MVLEMFEVQKSPRGFRLDGLESPNGDVSDRQMTATQHPLSLSPASQFSTIGSFHFNGKAVSEYKEFGIQKMK